jgi:hypothetical protein
MHQATKEMEIKAKIHQPREPKLIAKSTGRKIKVLLKNQLPINSKTIMMANNIREIR